MNKNDLIDIEEKCEKTLKEFGYMMPWFYSIDNTRKLELGIALYRLIAKNNLM